jgi:hypothetical protein
VEAALIYTDSRTDRKLDMTKLRADSRDDANASKNIQVDLKGQDVWYWTEFIWIVAETSGFCGWKSAVVIQDDPRTLSHNS